MSMSPTKIKVQEKDIHFNKTSNNARKYAAASLIGNVSLVKVVHALLKFRI